MTRKGILAVVLSAILVLSVAAPVSAAGVEEVEQTKIEERIEDIEPPVVTGVSLDKTSAKAGETVTITLDAYDKGSGILTALVEFQDPNTLETINTDFYNVGWNNNLQIPLEIDSNTPSGNYELYYIYVYDYANNTVVYEKNPYGDSLPLPHSLTLSVQNDGQIDSTDPVLKNLTIDKDTYEVGETLNATLDATDESGIVTFSAIFQNKDTLQTIVTDFSSSDDPLHGQAKINEYLVPGVFELIDVTIEDGAGNTVSYGSYEDDNIPDVKFTVTNSNNEGDLTPPTLYSATLNKNTVKSGESFEMTIKADDNLSGIANFAAFFINPENDRQIVVEYSANGSLTSTAYVNEWEPSGVFYLDEVVIHDNANNTAIYRAKLWDDREIQLPFELSVTVVNDDTIETPDGEEIPMKPVDPDYKPHTPSEIVNYESEKPNPADKEAVELYNFWQSTKRGISITHDGDSFKVYVPKDIEYMPASVMETLRKANVTIELSWNGEKIVIPAGAALEKPPLKAYWTFETLKEVYSIQGLGVFYMEKNTEFDNIVAKYTKVFLFLIALVLIGILCWQSITDVMRRNKIQNYAQQAGLVNVILTEEVNDKYSFTLQCDNFNATNWDTLMTMDQNIRNLHEDIDMKYSQGQFDYRIHQSDNTIIEIDDDVEIEYNGSWESHHRINTAAEEKKRQEQNQRVQQAIADRQANRVSASKCDICGKQATHNIGSEYYCTKHYSDAYEWYVEQAAQKLVE